MTSQMVLGCIYGSNKGYHLVHDIGPSGADRYGIKDRHDHEGRHPDHRASFKGPSVQRDRAGPGTGKEVPLEGADV